MKKYSLFFWALSLYSGIALAEEPSLPSGLGSEPTLPTFSSEPDLPSGLVFEKDTPNTTSTEKTLSAFSNVTGFWETRIGQRLRNDAYEKPFSIGETRLQLQADKEWDFATGHLSTDFVYDPVQEEHALDLDEGRGWLDVREANLLFRPTDTIDVKLGRQILTWGTGDLLFINDLFPKDWNSFFIGRDDEYLKAPSDAVKLSWFTPKVNIDVVYTPEFDSDRYIDGQRLSYYNSNTNQLSGRNAIVRPEQRNSWLNEDEIALRLYKHVGSYEIAGYLYSGYWKSPAGQTTTAQPTFPALNVYGASIRGPLYKGIANAEVGYYDSKEDKDGTNGYVDNSQIRALAGYEQELRPNLTGGIQYYIERMQHHDRYLANLGAGVVPKDQTRHLITLRLTQLLYQQNLKLSLFNFYSPTDQDGHARLKANYKLNDKWQVEGGGNIFYSSEPSSFFGGFQDDSNVFVGLRYSF